MGPRRCSGRLLRRLNEESSQNDPQVHSAGKLPESLESSAFYGNVLGHICILSSNVGSKSCRIFSQLFLWSVKTSPDRQTAPVLTRVSCACRTRAENPTFSASLWLLLRDAGAQMSRRRRQDASLTGFRSVGTRTPGRQNQRVAAPHGSLEIFMIAAAGIQT